MNPRAAGGTRQILAVIALAGAAAWSAEQPPAASQQAPPRDAPAALQIAGTAIVRGRVVSAVDGTPIRGARVEVRVSGVAAQLTTADGRFEFTGLRPSRYSFTASKTGYATLTYGQRAGRFSEPARSIELAEGETVDGVEIVLPKGSVIAGQVMDERGQPVTGARVAAARWQWNGGRLFLSSGGNEVTDVTDDRGEFRLFDLPAGTYVLGAVVRNPLGSGFVTIFYPSQFSPAESQPIVVRPGDEYSANLTLMRTSGGTISGVVRGGDGAAVRSGQMSVYAAQDVTGPFGQGSSAAVRPDGSYIFPQLPPGEYVLSVSTVAPAPYAVATSRVILSGTDIVVPLALEPGYALRGRFVFDTPPPQAVKPSARSPQFRITPVDATSLRPFNVTWMTHEDWTFEVAGFSGRFLFQAPAPEGWSVKAIRRAGADITDAPLEFAGQDIDGVEIELTQRITRLSGRVADGGGPAGPDMAVVVFAEDETKLAPGTRLLRRVGTGRGGTYTITGLPPARYLAVALADLDAGEETNPDTLRRLRPLGTPFVLAEGEARVVDLSTSDVGSVR